MNRISTARDDRAADHAIYLDNNATTRALPEVRDAVADALDGAFGNPSSTHSTGERARRCLFEARQAVADLVGADAEQVYFTSGGTEANNIVILSAAEWPAKGGVVTTAIEHSSVLKSCEHLETQGIRVTYLPPTAAGSVDPEMLEAAIRDQAPRLVAIQWVNNETGVIQPMRQIADICAQHGVPLLSDGAQAIGKLPLSFGRDDIDFLSLTAHKFHGPPGVGALIAKDPSRLRPIMRGGEQERGLRPGTENFPGIVGLGVAAAIRTKRLEAIRKRVAAMRDAFEAQLLARFPFVRVNGDRHERVFNTTNLCFHGLDGQALVARFDAADVRCSQSSACTNSRPEPSYVLRAMGLTESDAYASVRFAFGEFNEHNEVGVAVDRMSASIETLAAILV